MQFSSSCFFVFFFRRKPRSQHQFCGNPGMRLITVFKGPLMMNRRMKYWLLQSICLSSELPRGCNFRIKGFGDDRSAIYERRLKSMFPVISTTRNRLFLSQSVHCSECQRMDWSCPAICWMVTSQSLTPVPQFFWQNQMTSLWRAGRIVSSCAGS